MLFTIKPRLNFDYRLQLKKMCFLNASLTASVQLDFKQDQVGSTLPHSHPVVRQFSSLFLHLYPSIPFPVTL